MGDTIFFWLFGLPLLIAIGTITWGGLAALICLGAQWFKGLL